MSEITSPAPAETTEAAPRLLTFDAIMAAPDIRTETVKIPEWGGAVEIQGLSLDQVDSIRAQAKIVKPGPGGKPVDDLDNDKFAYLLLAEAVVNPPLTYEQAIQLKQKASMPVTNLMKRVLAISGLTKEATEEAEKSAGAES